MSLKPVALLCLLSLPVSAQTCPPTNAVSGSNALIGPVCGAPVGPIRTTLTTSAGTATFNYSSAGFTAVPVVQCTVENSSTSVAYVAQIAAKSSTSATINVLNSQAPALSGNILALANISVGQPFASTTSGAVQIDCAAAMPTQ